MKKTALLTSLAVLILTCQLSGQNKMDPDESPSGRIILNGRLLEPPYEITSIDSTIRINGKALFSIGKEKPIVIDSTTPLKSRLVHEAIDSFANAYKQVGKDSALQLILDFFSGYDIVDSAYIDKSGNFSVKYSDLNGPIWIWLQPPTSDKQPPTRKHADQLLDEQARLIRSSIANGNLVLIHNGSVRAFLKDARQKIKNIEEIYLSDNLDNNAKLQMVFGIVKDIDCAKDIIENWKQ